MITGTLKSAVDKLWETFWTGGIANPLTVIEQITYLLFLRRLDENQTLKEKQANKLGGSIKNPIYTPEQNVLRWSSFKNEDPEVMFERFTRPQVDELSVFDFMKQIGADGSEFSKHMKGATFMIPTPRLLDKAVQMIDEIDMHDRDTKGDLYEYLLSKIASAGQNGQFRTPRHIIRLMVEMVEPKMEDRICDPSAGTAGFLVAASEYFHRHHKDAFFDKTFRDHYDSQMFNGIEFDASMMRIGAMNLMLHGIDYPSLISRDALSEANAGLSEVYDLILANPPFKGSLDYDAVDNQILQIVKSKKTELLFLGLMLRMLKPGGRAAVIVPDGVLFGSSKAHKQIRQEIITNHQLQAVVSMPSGVFKPYAGVSTAILFFTKTNRGGTDQVWFYDMQKDGFSLDDKRTPHLSEEEQESAFMQPAVVATQQMEKSNLADILHRWRNLEAERENARTTHSFMVSVSEIEENDWDLSLNRYKEIEYEVIEYESPFNILDKIDQLDTDRQKLMAKLRAQLSGIHI